MATTQSIPLQTLGGQTADAQPAPSPVQSQDRGSPPVELDYWRRQYHRMKWVETETRANMPLLDFENLQHLNLFHLDSTSRDIQDDMDKSKITTESQCKLLRETLHNYATAIRDYKYLLELPRDGWGTRPFILDLTGPQPNKQATDAVREFLRKRLPIRLSYSGEELGANFKNYNRGNPPVTYSPFVDRLARFLIAVGGGAALIVPMLIMSFQPSQTKSLVTVSVAVVLFALTISLAFSTDNKDTLQATATYAAILVVFVGTSGTSG